jgi:hypothetical protein
MVSTSFLEQNQIDIYFNLIKDVNYRKPLREKRNNQCFPFHRMIIKWNGLIGEKF